VNPILSIVLTLAGVVVPSSLLAWAVSRWLTPVSLRLAALLVGIVLVTLHLGVFTSLVPVPLDEVVRGYPYKGVVGEVTSRNPTTNDSVKQMLPWMEVVREELFAGRAPVWNRYSFSGYPLVGNGQSAALSPYLLATLFVPLPGQLVAMAGLKLFVALLFGVLFLREEGAGKTAALAGAMAFAFSVYQNVYLYYPHTSVSALLPAMAWSIVRCMRGGGARDRVALALVTAAAFSSGHPESVLHLAMASAVVMGVEAASGPSRRSLSRLSGLTVAFAFLGVMLAAAAWVPLAAGIGESQRLESLEAGGEVSPAFPGTALWAAIHPDGFGNPARGTWRWMFNYPMVAPTFVGLVPLMLLPGALVAGRSDRRTRLFAVSSLVFLLLALKWTVIGKVFAVMPLVETAANDRLRFVVVFFVATAAARRLGVLERSGPSVVDLVSGFVLLGYSVYVFRKLAYATIVQGHVVITILLAAFLAACLAASMSLWRNWKLEGAGAIPVVAAMAIGVELFLVNLPYNALVPGGLYAPRLPIVEKVHEMAPDEPYRIVGHDWVLMPNASAQYGLEDVRGSDPMAWGPYTRFFERLQTEDMALDVLRTQRHGDSAVDFLNIRFLLGEPGFDAGEGWRRIYSGSDGDLFENEQWVRRFFAPARLLPASAFDARNVDDLRDAAVVDDPSLTEPRDNPPAVGMWISQMAPSRFRLTIDASAETFIASSQPAMKGWKVEIDGETADIVRVNGAFIGFRVPAGTSKVKVSYEPLGWKIGLVASLLAVVALLASAGVGRGRSREPGSLRQRPTAD
jgi:hypothetical protein